MISTHFPKIIQHGLTFIPYIELVLILGLILEIKDVTYLPNMLTLQLGRRLKIFAILWALILDWLKFMMGKLMSLLEIMEQTLISTLTGGLELLVLIKGRYDIKRVKGLK